MADPKNPIKITLLNKNEYKIELNLGTWQLSKVVSENALKGLKSEIDSVMGLTKITEAFDCSGVDALKIKEFWDNRRNWELCNKCNFKWEKCFDCVVVCDCPLERTMLLEFTKQDINPILQLRINKDGGVYHYPEEIDFDKILTIPDFYLEKDTKKICIYADGHTYHERTERQALRDRNIDRELQNLGYKVLRYTGKEIRDDVSLTIENIKVHIE